MIAFLWIPTYHKSRPGIFIEPALRTNSHVDAAVLDFAKASDKVTHHSLLQKLKQYNLNIDVIGWVEIFL